jgi:hypothetical protein
MHSQARRMPKTIQFFHFIYLLFFFLVQHRLGVGKALFKSHNRSGFVVGRLYSCGKAVVFSKAMGETRFYIFFSAVYPLRAA